MEFLKKLFGKKSSKSITSLKTHQMMDEDEFWNIIKKSLKKSTNQEEQLKHIKQQLINYKPNEIVGFRLRTDYYLSLSYTSDLWCAAYLINGGCSDDSFEYFRCWLISCGKERFYSALSNADTLDTSNFNIDEYDFEDFWYVAIEALSDKYKLDLYECIDYDNFNYGEGKYPEIEFDWSEEDQNSMKIKCPNLFQKFNK